MDVYNIVKEVNKKDWDNQMKILHKKYVQKSNIKFQ